MSLRKPKRHMALDMKRLNTTERSGLKLFFFINHLIFLFNNVVESKCSATWVAYAKPCLFRRIQSSLQNRGGLHWLGERIAHYSISNERETLSKSKWMPVYAEEVTIFPRSDFQCEGAFFGSQSSTNYLLWFIFYGLTYFCFDVSFVIIE